jgi:hypothetical protein
MSQIHISHYDQNTNDNLECVGGLQLLLGYPEEQTTKSRIIGTLTLGRDY